MVPQSCGLGDNNIHLGSSARLTLEDPPHIEENRVKNTLNAALFNLKRVSNGCESDQYISEIYL